MTAGLDSQQSRRALWALWVVVLVDLIGFGILNPLIPFYALRTGLSVDAITLVIAAYSLAQFLMMPIWGHLSDRFGRRPILLFSMLGHAATYCLLAVADTWYLLLAARVLGGITAANLATAYAYTADITPKSGHAKAFGRISAAFGLGFVIGPALGGLLAGGGDELAQVNFVAPAMAAAGLSLASCIGILFFLPESRPVAARFAQPNMTQSEKTRPVKAQPGLLEGLRAVGGHQIIMGLLFVGLMVISFMAVREAILAIWAHDRLGLNPRQIGMVVACSGGVIVLMQFFAMGPLSRRFGSERLVQVAMLLFALCWLALTLSQSLWHVMLATALGGIGTALFQTNLQTLVAREAGQEDRGLVLGAYQSSSALARFVGPAVAGSSVVHVGKDAPFLIGAIVMVPAFLLLRWVIQMRTGASTPAAGRPSDVPAE